MLELELLLESGSYAVVFFIVFAETALLIGSVLPGDSLLITVGLLASRGIFRPTPLVIGIWLAAVAGDTVGYLVGRLASHWLHSRRDSRFFRRVDLDAATAFFARYGVIAAAVSRFIPFVRALTPAAAGAAAMPINRYLPAAACGGLLWTASFTLGAYYLGRVVPGLNSYILEIVIAMLVIGAGAAVVIEQRRRKARPGGPERNPAD